MTAVMTEAAAVIAEGADAIVSAWALFRRSQLIPAGTPDVMNARARLLRLLEPHARSFCPAGASARQVDAIDDAADWLVVIAEFRFGTETASFVAGDGELPRVFPAAAEGGERS